MWGRSTKQRKAARFRRQVARGVSHPWPGVSILSMLAVLGGRLSPTRLRAQGWRPSGVMAALARPSLEPRA